MPNRFDSWRRLLLHDEHHGPLPALLLALTAVSGLVDAVSILSLGRVFVANMTGNVVFIGFAIAGAPGFSLGASVSALAGFVVGAALGGGLVTRVGSHRGRVLLAGCLIEIAGVAAGVVILAIATAPFPAGVEDCTAGLLAIALGIQNSVVRSLGVPDLTTTVLTMALTGLVADARGGLTPPIRRRLLAVITMFAGAAIGAVLVLHVSPAAGLGAALALLVLVVVVLVAVSGGDRAWHRLPT